MAVSQTAEYVALYRALETTETRREPLFRDPFARHLLTGSRLRALRLATMPGLRSMLERYADHRAPGARTSAIGRTRFIDDVVRAERARGIRYYVILGAGYDSRAHRLVELKEARVFEVDRAETQAEKRRRIESVPGVRKDV
ncbi:MAG TPA: class I SAM-dependent methyltransferase, partial [Kofleriaceae bacterium]|nr:class I SAM-dependent methyltransferase [Kofleriaceae bacterium]